MPIDVKTNEWTLLRDQFRALARNEGGREDSLEQCLDYQVRRRIGDLIASSVGHQTVGFYGVTKDDYAAWPPDPGHTNR